MAAMSSAGAGWRKEDMPWRCPSTNVDGVIWFDGKLVPWRDAKIHVLTHGLHYASCVFEGERAYGGEIFKCTEHSERLKQLRQTSSISRFPIRSPRSTPPSSWCSRRTT